MNISKGCKKKFIEVSCGDSHVLGLGSEIFFYFVIAFLIKYFKLLS